MANIYTTCISTIVNIKLHYVDNKKTPFQVIEKVLKKNHMINGTAIEVCRYVPPHPPKQVPMYSNKVFITEISEETIKDVLENFLKTETNVAPVSIEYGEQEGTALITFEEDIGEYGHVYSTFFGFLI